MLAAFVTAGQMDLDPRTVVLFPDRLITGQDIGLVFLHVEHDLETVGRMFLARAAVDGHRLTGGQLAVHAGGRDTDALLPATLLQ